MKLLIEPISPEAFAPHGTVVEAPTDIGRNAYQDALPSLADVHTKYGWSCGEWALVVHARAPRCSLAG